MSPTKRGTKMPATTLRRFFISLPSPIAERCPRSPKRDRRRLPPSPETDCIEAETLLCCGVLKVVAVLGGQWGDEGKGKVVDLLSDRFDVVARYHGGHNAGHTVKFGDRHFALHLLPSGIVRGRRSVIGAGLVVDPQALLAEIAELEAAGVAIEGRLLLSDRAQVILPYHRLLDAAREKAAGDSKIGTTLRGIGPAYESAAARRGIRVVELLRRDVLSRRIEMFAAECVPLLSALGEKEIPEAAKVAGELIAAGEKLQP